MKIIILQIACLWCKTYKNHWDVCQCETEHYLYLKKKEKKGSGI